MTFELKQSFLKFISTHPHAGTIRRMDGSAAAVFVIDDDIEEYIHVLFRMKIYGLIAKAQERGWTSYESFTVYCSIENKKKAQAVLEAHRKMRKSEGI